MALFSKPPAKKPVAPGSERADDAPRGTPPRDSGGAGRRHIAQRAAADAPGPATLTGASLIDWSHAYSAIEVAETNPGLCAVLENAALLYAAGQPDAARATLGDGIANDTDTKMSPFAWLAMFDLLQRSNLRAEFDEFALQYVVQFERSAPGWDETRPDAAQHNASSGGYVAPAGKLTGSGVQLAGLRRAIDKRVPHARLDLSSVASFDDEGAHMLADLLAQARRHKVALTIERPEKLVEIADAMVKRGKDGGQGAWQLSLELLQWRHEQAVFDDRAVEFAVTFEVSPPSWDPPPDVAALAALAAADKPETVARPLHDENGIAFVGSLIGPNVAQINHFTDYAHRREVVVIDMAGVDRMDFVCAGAFLNALGRIESQRKSVQIVGASPIVRALLLLIGVSPRNFVKKTG